MKPPSQTTEAPLSAGRLPRAVRELLRKRGIADDLSVEAFLNPSYAKDLADPFLMSDMAAAIDRIQLAIKQNQKVAVYGDYDIDGIVSTTLMLEVLQQYGLEVVTYIPDRYVEGYGINIKALEGLKADKVDLIISVDCGITSVAEANWAQANGLELIITDHHEAPIELPDAVAVINPRREGDQYPFKDLAGVGVAFNLARALQQRTGSPAIGQEKWLLDLVALGTVCDVMPLVGENRTLVTFGLVVLRKTRRTGLVALAQSAGVDLSELKAYHLGYSLGPRMNAAGRMEHANYSLELLLSRDPVEAQAFAFQLEELNHQRQLETERIFKEADAMAAKYAQDPVLVLSDPHWPHGVVGIVASKLAEKWTKPTLVLQELGDHVKGSGRSANGYNLIEGLRSRADLFTKLGGHHFAAGFTAPIINIDDIRTTLISDYVANSIEPTSAKQREADIEIENPEDVNWELYESLSLLEPFGSGNSEPIISLRDIKVVDVDIVGSGKQHLKLRLSGGTGTILQAIGFGMVEKYPNIKSGQTVDVLCYLQKNQWNDRSTLQLMLVAIQ